jgi:hypothetical protein
MTYPTADETLKGYALDDDDPTERFALQTCPACEGITTVPLWLTQCSCQFCAHVLDVSPFVA